MSVTKEAIEEIINEITEYLKNQGGKVQITAENDRTVIKLESPLELSAERYNEELYNFLNNLGFFASNTAEDQVNDYWGYKSWIGVDVYRNSTGTELVIYYTKVWTKGETIYYVKKIEVIPPEEGEIEE